MPPTGAHEAAAMNQTSMELEGDRDFVISRTFNGPARIVFDAYTKPELVQRWWAPKSLGDAVLECEADVRVGGGYRYVMRGASGEAFAFSGKYTEVTAPTRLVFTQLFEPTASGTAEGEEGLVITVTFEERNGKTHLVSHARCPSSEVRDMILASGMEHGMRETMDQLDELVATLS